nr:MAG TPA: protein of unknown function (DUF2065) [Inoviridae sp.]
MDSRVFAEHRRSFRIACGADGVAGFPFVFPRSIKQLLERLAAAHINPIRIVLF